MEELKALLETILNEELLHIVISGQKTKEVIQKIRIRPVQSKSGLCFQAALWDGKKEFHRNYTSEELLPELLVWMDRDFKQMQIETTSRSVTVLISKKGKVTIKTRQIQKIRPKASLTHNREKRYLLPEGTPVPFLVELGVMTPEGKVIRAKYDKFRQINRFLEFIEDICPVLEKDRELTMIDFGCGKSYLTFAIYYYLHEIRGYDLRIIGLDLKEDVIAHCNALARKFGYEKLQFLTGDIADYEGVSQVDLVVTLHACDTATDYALAKAVAWNARAILSVPCCQHELNGQIHSEILQPVLKYGLIKERMAALITDGLRAGLLEEAGYKVQVLEFIDMEHTPKNILLRAVREHTPDRAPESSQGLQECMEFLQVKPTLAELLRAMNPSE
jgi:SAM-dependent methyltransferase